MGLVLLAQDPVLDRHVAIKLLRSDLGLSADHQRQLFDRMRQEARASARVSHPNIVALFDMGEDDKHGLFLVFEYVIGHTLKDQIRSGPLEPLAAARMAIELGEALSTAHAAGVLHRDIKPENVILSPTGGKIADFGIARIPESTLTRDGRLLGTPAYSSPEAISHGTFSAQSDQFSLATTLYEALSQTRAFPGDDAVKVATLITTSPAEPIADRCALDPMVDVVLRQAMHHNPSARFASCSEFGHALSNALGGTSTRFGPIVPLPATAGIVAGRDRDVGSRTLRIVAGAGALGALLMAALLQMSRGCQADSSKTLPRFEEEAPLDSAGALRTSTAVVDQKTRARSRSAESARRTVPGGGSSDRGSRPTSTSERTRHLE